MESPFSCGPRRFSDRLLAERRDSVWSSEELPMPMRDKALSYDLACRPSLTFKDSLWQGCLGLKTDSSWDTNVVFSDPSGYTIWFSLTRPAWRRNGNCALIEADVWSMGGLIDGYYVHCCRRDSGVWTYFGGAGGLDGDGYGFAALADSSDSIHAVWSARDPYFTNELVCDAFTLDSCTPWAAACLDDSGRVQCTWARDGMLKFVLVPGPTLDVVGVSEISWCDITTDTLSQPVIAYCVSDGSIYVAHGVDVAGLNNGPQEPVVHRLQGGASIVKDVLFLPTALSPKSQAASCLLDISGRRVLDLVPGANDVSGLAPGVYFVRWRSAVGGERTAAYVRKVVVQH